jgi:hypothetical protein
MRELISLRAFGLSEIDAIYCVALKMVEHGLMTAPNMACGEPYNVGITAAQIGSLAGAPAVADSNGHTGVHAAHTVPTVSPAVTPRR